jgi:hypothetical protein
MAVLAMMREILRLRKPIAALCLDAQAISVTARQRIETRLGADNGMLSGREDARSPGLKNTM